MQLFFAPETCSLASHLALECAGAAFELRRVDLAAGEQQSASYRAINPKGRVPALATPHGVLTETPAILAYIASCFPRAQLMPEDKWAFAQAQAFNSFLCSTLHVAHAHRMRGARWSDDPDAIASMQRKVPESVGAAFLLVETSMLAGPWVMGDNRTACDFYLFTLARWMEMDGVDPASFPKVRALRERLSSDPMVRRVLARETTAS
jgi:glutathione S-transferase